ncbi:MAG TPA: BTAD domain-containing putative transcriptional regulator, partial [Trebonia sp.]|nr:BTAD domain-containing putative transcriptional regulator [Trebonia sp.]
GVLGPLAVTDAAGRPVRVGGQRVRALLAVLALAAGRPVPAHALIERLWPEPDDRPVDAVNALQSLVSRLRAALRQGGVAESVLESSPAGYRLAVRPEAVDAAVFEAAARAGGRALAAGDPATAARLLREALGTWRGPALADVAGEEFAAAPAARLEELRSAAVLDRIEADLALGEAVAVTGELRELTAADPLAERPRALLMRALAAAGRQADALAVYAEGRELLADRLGVDPSPRLAQAHLAVLRQEIPLAVPAGTAAHGHPERTPPSPGPSVAVPGGQRPFAAQRPPTSFIGRDDDVAGVLKKLAEERLVTLTGPGGVGKTRLATEVAARLAGPAALAGPAPLTGPAALAGLAPISDPSEVPYAVLDALGLRERVIARHGADQAHADPADRLCAALGDRQAVLILDNCEHLVEAAASLADRLLTDCPRTRIIATSREPLRIPGETLWVVAPLPVPPVSGMAGAESAPAIPEISTYAAVRLFCDRAAAVLPGFALDDGNVPAVMRICQALDGMPLAVELAAPWLRTLPPAQLAERLDDRFALLTGGSRTALPRHQTLRAVIDWSWNLLSEPERVLARRLAVFPGGATLAAAEQVCPGGPGAGGAGLARGDVLPALSGLVAKSILSAADGAGERGPRYRMLETVRAYGLERLAEAGEETAVRDAMAAYYLDFAETADPLLRTGQQRTWHRALTAEQDNINAALRWAIARRDAATALRFVRALGFYWTQRGRGEGDALAREVFALEPPGDSLLMTEARVACAVMTVSATLNLTEVREPLAAAIESLTRFADAGQPIHPMAAAAVPLVAMFDRDTDTAIAAIDRYAKSSDDPWMRATGRMYRSTYAANAGRLDGAEADCAAALEQFRAIGDPWGIAVCLYQMAEFAALRADHARAVAALAEAEQIGLEIDAWGDRAYIIGSLAVARARAGDVDGARADLGRAERAAAARSQDNADEWLILSAAEVEWRAGDLAAAARRCEAALAGVAKRDKDTAWWVAVRAQSQARLAMITLEVGGDAGRCRDLLAEALPAAAGWVENPPLAAVIDSVAAAVVERDGAAEAAAALLGAAHTVRGAFDESSPVAPRVRKTARRALGDAAFDGAYSRGRELDREAALELAGRALAAI